MKSRCKNCKKELVEGEKRICNSCINGLKAKYRKGSDYDEAVERIIDFTMEKE